MIRKNHTELNDVELLHRLHKNKRFRQSIERGVAREVGFDPNRVVEGLSQVDRVFESYFKPARGRDKLEVVVCHGNLIRALLCRAMGVPAECWLSMMPVHCGITIIGIENAQRMRVLSFNESQHLPAHMRTEQ